MDAPKPLANAARLLECSARHVAGRAAAKLNLFLEVLGRRADGFHELDTVYHEIDLADEIRVELGRAGTDELITQGLAISGDPAQNLALRAVRAFRAQIGPVPALRIE